MLCLLGQRANLEPFDGWLGLWVFQGCKRKKGQLRLSIRCVGSACWLGVLTKDSRGCHYLQLSDKHDEVAGLCPSWTPCWLFPFPCGIWDWRIPFPLWERNRRKVVCDGSLCFTMNNKELSIYIYLEQSQKTISEIVCSTMASQGCHCVSKPEHTECKGNA